MHLDSVSSTQDEARRRFDGRPLLVIAASQSEGRGRQGRRWDNAPRAVAASLALLPAVPQAAWPTIPLTAGLSARRVMDDRLRLKWPNDVVDASGRKLAGLLVESDPSLLVVGLGVNLWWPGPPDGVTALYDEDPGPAAGADLAERWARDLLARLSGTPGAWDRREYLSVSSTIGCDVTWEPDGSGRAVDVDPRGGLIVETAAGIVVIGAGGVRTVRTATLPPANEERL